MIGKADTKIPFVALALRFCAFPYPTRMRQIAAGVCLHRGEHSPSCRSGLAP